MGGPGSGSWDRIDKKPTVEESLTLAIEDIRGRIFSESPGKITWTWGGGITSSIGYSVSSAGRGPTITLRYRWGAARTCGFRFAFKRPRRTLAARGGGSPARRWLAAWTVIGGPENCISRLGRSTSAAASATI